MKRKILLAALIVFFVCACSFGLAACEEEHTHTYAEGWSKNETEHWHDSTCGHADAVADLGEHVFGDDNVCDVCGYERIDVNAEFSVVFDANGGLFGDGTEQIEQTVKYGSNLQEPQQPSRSGHELQGWSLREEGGEMWSFGTDTVTEDITLYAVWEQIPAIIQNIENAELDGNEIFMIVPQGTDSVPLADAVECSEGSVWRLYHDELGQSEIPTKTAAGLADGDNVLYIIVTDSASTEFNTYTLTIHRRYEAVISYYDGETLLYTDSAMTGEKFFAGYVPDIRGYTFEGWLDAEGEAYNGSVIWKELSLFARKTANTYTVTFDENGGGAVEDVKATFGETFAFAVPEREGYTFDGWSYNGELVTDGTGTGLSVWDFAFSLTLEAVWTINEYTVSLSSENEEYGTVEGGGVFEYDSRVSVVAEPVENYSFIGWYEDETLVSEEAEYTFRMPARDVTLTAKWAIFTLTTSCGAVEGGTYTQYTERAFTAGERIILNVQTESGYTWLGWYEGDELFTRSLSYGFYMPKSDLVLQSRWMECPVTVETSDGEAGRVSGMPETTVAGETIDLTAKTNEGYTWVGWYLGETLVSEELSISFVMPESDAEKPVYTATWIYYTASAATDGSAYTHATVTFNTNGADCSVPSQTVTSAIGLEYPETPEWTGHIFRGWYTDAECTEVYDFTADITQDLTLYAGWTSISRSSYYNLRIMDILRYNSSSNRFSVGISGSSSREQSYVYFSIPTDGTYTLYFGTSGINFTNYQVSKIAGTASGASYSGQLDGGFASVRFTAEAGAVICLSTYRASTAAGEFAHTVYTYVIGGTAPEDGGVSRAHSAERKVTVGEEVTFTVEDANEGHYFIGWYDGDTLLTKEREYTFTMPAENVSYTARWSKIALEKSDSAGGTVKQEMTGYTENDAVTLTAETNGGYVWLGWYNGETLLTRELVYTCNMPAEGVTYTAKWIECPVTLEKNGEHAGEITVLDGAYKLGDEVTVTATTNEGYTWVGWYNGEELLTEEMSYTFEMPEEPAVFTATWSTNIPYIDGDGSEAAYTGAAVEYLSALTENRTLTEGWYLLSGTVAGDYALTVDGEAHIILADGSDWQVSNVIVGAEDTLYIYAQSTGDAAGKLTVSGNIGGEDGAKGESGTDGSRGTMVGGIGGTGDVGGQGGDCGTVVINGGVIAAAKIGGGDGGEGGQGGLGGTGGDYGGRGGNGGVGGTGGDSVLIVINGGIITAGRIGGGEGGHGGYGTVGGYGSLRNGSTGSNGNGGAGGDGGMFVFNGGTLTVKSVTGGAGGEVEGDKAKPGVDGEKIGVFYFGTEEEWRQTELSSKVSSVRAEVYFYSETDPFEGEGAAESGNFWHIGEDGLTPVIWVKSDPGEGEEVQA